MIKEETITKLIYCEAKKVKPSQMQFAKHLNINVLDFLQMWFFKLTVKTQALKAMVKSVDLNPMTKLWITINKNGLFIQQLNEYLKLIKIAMVSMLRSIGDE